MTRTSTRIAASALAAALAGTALGLTGCAADVVCDVSVDNSAKQAAEKIVASVDEAGVREVVGQLVRAQFGDDFFNAARVEYVMGMLKNGTNPDVVYDAAAKIFTATIDDGENTHDPANSDTFTYYTSELALLVKTLASTQELGFNIADLDKDALLGSSCALTVNLDLNGQEPLEHNFQKVVDGIYSSTVELGGQQLWEIVSGQGLGSADLPALFAAFSDAYKTTSDISFDVGRYTNSNVVSISTPGIIESIKVNKVEQPACSTVMLPKEGNYTIAALLTNGHEAQLKTTLDFTAPTATIGGAKVKEGKTIKVKKGAALRFSDKNGVKSAKLGGKAIKNKAAVKRAGKLVITDKAGNKLTATVKLK